MQPPLSNSDEKLRPGKKANGEGARTLDVATTSAGGPLGQAAPPAQRPAAASASRFTILSRYAEGGVGRVHLARDEQLHRTVALKEIRPERADQPQTRQRFLAEAEITGQLEHPGIVPIYALEQDAGGRPVYAMRFIQGRTLRDAIGAFHDRPSLLGLRELLQRFIVVCQTMAAAYCNWLSQQEGLPQTEWCYAKGQGKIPEGMVTQKGYLARKGYRLPTEAEWEYACRAGAVTSRPYGRSEALLGKYDLYQGNAGERAHPVGLLRPNDLGLFDVLGNAGEWCQDHFGRYPGAEPGEPVIDDEEKNRSEQTNRVIRGSGFSNLVLSARSASREAAPPEYRMNATGLRVARTAD